MSAIEALLFVIALIYLTECAAWVRRNTVAFRARVRRGWRIVEAFEWAGNETGGIVFGRPLPPLSPLILTPLWPVSLGREGVASYVAQALRSHGRPRQLERFVAWGDIEEVVFDEKKVLVNGELFYTAGSELEADFVAGVIDAAVHAEDRERALRESLRESLDAKAIGERMESFGQATSNLRFTCNSFALVVLGMIPLMLYWVPLFQRWYLVVGLAVALLGLLLHDYRRAHKALYPDRTGHRHLHSWMSLASPMAAIRARDAIARDLLVGYHPLAVASVICRTDDFRRVARGLLADVRHPLEPVCEAGADVAQAERESRAVLQEEMERFLRRQKLDPDELLAPPARDGDESRSYCPRCDGQYAVAEGVCDACGGVALKPYA